MASKITSEKGAKNGKGQKPTGARSFAVFPTNIASLDKTQVARLVFKPEGMAAEVLQALKKHGMGAGESREKVAEQVKAKFPKASDATIKTQMYRGIVYLRGRNQEPIR